MRIKPAYTVHDPNHNKTNFNFSFKVAELDFLGGIPPKFEH